MLKEWLYFLVDTKTGRTYDLDEDDVLVTTPSPVFLDNSPDGWQEQEVQYRRNTTYFGIWRSFTIPLRFVLKGARTLRKLIYTYGVEASCSLVIMKLDLNDYKHKLWYSGEIDMSRAVDQKDFFDVNVAEGGFVKNLKDNERTVYEIPLSTGSETLELDGIALKQSTTSLVYGFSNALFVYRSHLPATSITNSEGEGVATLVRSTNYHDLPDQTNNGAIAATNDPIFKAQSNSTLIFTYDIRFKTAYDEAAAEKLKDPNLRVRVDVRIFNNGSFKQAINIYQSTSDLGIIIGPPIGVFLKGHEVKGEMNIPLAANDEVYVYVYGNILHDPNSAFGGSEWLRFYYIDVNDQTFTQGTVNFGFEIKYPPTKVKAKRADILFQDLVSKVSGGTYTASCPLLVPTGNGNPGTEFRALLITSGDGVRNIDNAVIKTTFEDFFKSINTIKNVGLGIFDKQVIMDAKSTFYTGDVVADFGEVKDIKITPATEHMFNAIKIGYPDNNYDDINGRNEFNTTYQWKTPITRVVNDLDLVSKYRGDCYGVEFARINLDGKTTTDSESDNDVFIIDAIGSYDPSGNIIWRPFRQLFLNVTGIISKNSVFNIGISPKRCLLAHGDYIRSFCYGLDDKEIVFQTADKNAELSTQSLTGEIITEKANVPVNTLKAPIFKPFNMEFTSEVPLNLVQLLTLARSGVFQFEYNGRKAKGSLIDGGIKPSTREEHQFKLLATVDTDLLSIV